MSQNNDFVFKLIEAFKFSNIEVAQKCIMRLSENNNLEELEKVIKNVRKWFKKD